MENLFIFLFPYLTLLFMPKCETQEDITLVYLTIDPYALVTSKPDTISLKLLSHEATQYICLERNISFAQQSGCIHFSQAFSPSGNIYTIDTAEVVVQNHTFKVIKYMYDDPGSEDEEEYIFYSDQFGIVCIKSVVWHGYTILHEKSDESRGEIELLTRALMNKKAFFGRR